jgi:hypothetical protein
MIHNFFKRFIEHINKYYFNIIMRYTYIVLIILITCIYYFSSNSTNNIQYVILSTWRKIQV